MKISLFSRKENKTIAKTDTRDYALHFDLSRFERYLLRAILFGGNLLIVSILILIVYSFGSNIYEAIEPKIVYHAYLKRGAGIEKGTPIYFSGVKIGKVDQIKFLPDNRIDVKMQIKKRYQDRILQGVEVELRRQFNLIGNMLINIIPSDRILEEPLQAGGIIPSKEHFDIIDALSYINFSEHAKALERVLILLENIFPSFENEESRQMITDAFNQIGPSIVRIAHILEEAEGPLIDILGEQDIQRTFQGVSKVFNDPDFQNVFRSIKIFFDDPNIRQTFEVTGEFLSNPEIAEAVHEFLQAVEPEKVAEMFESGSRFFFLMEDIVDKDSPLNNTLAGMERVMDDKAFEEMSEAVIQLSQQFESLDPEIKTMIHEMAVSLKALQKTWLLKGKVKKARHELDSVQQNP